MKTIMQLIFVSIFMLVTTPSYSGVAAQMWKCEMVADTSEEDVEKMAQDWLKAAKQVEGGEKLEAYVYFPVAVNVTGATDLMFVVVAPSFESWGKFWDRYPDSEAAKAEDKNKIVCPDSALWESKKVK